MIAASQIYLGRGGAKLPYDAEVEYLESTGTQWIDTGVDASLCNTKLMEIECLFSISQSSKTYNGVFGAEVPCFGVYALREGLCYGYAVAHDSVKGFAFGDWINAKCSFTKGAQKVNFDGDEFTSNTSLDLASLNIGIFCRNYVPSPPHWLAEMRLKYFTMKVDSEQVRDMIPVRFTNELGQSEGAMYDRVSKQLFRNQGTGEFLYGGDVYSVPVETSRYVQDGLVAMWDGKENVGVGLHSPNATVWKDLVGSCDLTIPANGTWISDAYVSAGYATSSGAHKFCEGDAFTIEAVCSVTANATAPRFITNTSGSSSTASGVAFYSTLGTDYPNVRSEWARTSGGFAYSSARSTSVAYGNRFHSAIVVDSSLKAYTYVNGAIVYDQSVVSYPTYLQAGYNETVKVFANNTSVGNCTGCCLRIYSRALTAAEIAANYTVDKARFNLP